MPITSRQTPIRTFSFINDGKKCSKNFFLRDGTEEEKIKFFTNAEGNW